jgi:hypothetical protein
MPVVELEASVVSASLDCLLASQSGRFGLLRVLIIGEFFSLLIGGWMIASLMRAAPTPIMVRRNPGSAVDLSSLVCGVRVAAGVGESSPDDCCSLSDSAWESEVCAGDADGSDMEADREYSSDAATRRVPSYRAGRTMWQRGVRG